jgi:Acyltransferase family.
MPVALRGLAIASIVIHHAYGNHSKGWIAVTLGLSGGMAFLLLLTGFNFARFSLEGGRPDVVREALWSFAKAMIIPSVAMVLVWGPFVGIDWRDLLLITNWYPHPGTAMFPVEFSGMIVQMCLMFWLLTWIPGFDRFWKRPLLASFLLFATGVLLVRYFPRPDLVNRLPWLYLWDFSLGLLVFFTLRVENQRLKQLLKPVLLICVCVAAYIAEGNRMPLYWLVIGLTLFLYVERIVLPYWLAHFIKMLSQATFTIFFTHWPLIVLVKRIIPHQPMLTWILSLSGSLLIWAVIKAGLQAWEFQRKQNANPWSSQSLTGSSAESMQSRPAYHTEMA